MKPRKALRIAFFAAVAVIAAGGVVLLGITVFGDKTPKASGDYAGMTQTQALLAECEARNLLLGEEELAQAYSQAEQDLYEYQVLGEEGHTLEELYQYVQVELLTEKLIGEVVTGIKVTDTEIRKWYDARYNALSEALAVNPGVFKSQQEYYDKFGGVAPLIIPEGYIRVKHILVEDEKTAQEVMARLKDGGDFDELIDEYCIDAGMFAKPYASLGYLVGPYESTVDYLEEFKKAALSLTYIGEHSDIIQTDSGYEIIRLTGRLEAASLSLKEVRDSIEAMLLKHKKEQKMKEILRQWTQS